MGETPTIPPLRAELELPLDGAGLESLRITPRAAELLHGGDERASALHRALARGLRLQAQPSGATLALDARDHVELPADTRRIEVFVGDAPLPVARVVFGPEPRLEGAVATLSSLELRYLADNGHPHPAAARVALRASLETDLHTHLAGAPRAEDLVRIGIEQDVSYPIALLEECGLHGVRADAAVRVGEDPQTPASGDRARLATLAAVSPELVARLVRALRLPLDRQSTFLDMERVYRLRSPITKHPRAFVPMLAQIARDLAASGVRYAELSAGEIGMADRLRAANAAVPEIEAQTGVRLRFLLAFSRHDDWEWDLDVLDRLDDLAASRLLVGVDFMGHETNSTLAFARQLDRVAAWAVERRPGFAVRVHAGENPAHPENVRIAIERAARPGVLMRVGHGVHGVDDKTMDLMRARGVVVEVNPSSNFALNNIQSSRELPLLRYLRAGVACVLGTDGHGTYQTDAALEVRAAWLSGATASDFEALGASERRYLALRDEADARLPRDAPVPDDRPLVHFVPDVTARSKAARAERDAALDARLRALAAERLGESELATWIGPRRAVSVAGAWARAWPAMPEAEQARVRSILDDLVKGLDPARVVLVTGGTRLGVEHEVHTRAAAAGVPVLGVLCATSPAEELEPTLAATTVLGESLYDKAAGLYALMKQVDGLCLFFGGGNVVNDEIQTAQNLRLRFLLLEGVTGASGNLARERPRNAFATAAAALARLDDTAFFRAPFEPFWHLGANPTVDAAIFRRAPAGGGLELLLIKREPDAAAEPERWALIGGFVHTEAPRGMPWIPGAEAPADALVREVREEAGLELAHVRDHLLHVGDFEGGGRDERDTVSAWSRTSLFAILLDDASAAQPIAGGDDACDARWWPVDELPSPLAFDHAKLVARAIVRVS